MIKNLIMKKIIALTVLVTLVLTGCKFIEKKKLFSKGADTLLNYTEDTSGFSDLDKVQTESDISADSLRNLYEQNASFGSKKAYMIVGAFLIPQNADKYAEKIRSMGYNSEIITAPNGFHMVAANSYDNLRQGVNEISKFRNEISDKAWVYLRK